VALSANGRYVAFTSSATTLVPDDTNGRYDVFLRDRRAGETHRISQATSGEQADADSNAPAISGNGRMVAFQSDAGNLAPDPVGGSALFVRDWRVGTTRMIPASQYVGYPEGNGFPALSADGRRIAFAANDADLVRGDTNGTSDVFVGHLPR
jgi:Tol biopolymer transport system component